MKKSLISFLALTIIFAFFLGQTDLLDYSRLPIDQEASKNISKTEDEKPEEIDEVDFQAAAIKRNDDVLTEEIDKKMSANKKVLIQNILETSEVANYKQNMVKGIEASLKTEADNPKRTEKIKVFAATLMEYPMAEQFEEILKKYSEEELEYLHNSYKHPANQQAMAIQKEKIEELTELTKNSEMYNPSPEKAELIADIIEASNALEHGTIIGDATTKPIFMAIHKKQNPKANAQEMEAFANKLMASTKPQQTKTMKKVMNWSFDQVDKDKLESYRQYVNQASDKKINDKYLEDMKKFDGDYGKFIADKVVDHLAKDLTSQSVSE